MMQDSMASLFAILFFFGFLIFLLLLAGVIPVPKRTPKPVLCQERWWARDPSVKCMRLYDHKGDHVWFDPGSGHGDDRSIRWHREEES